MQTTNYKPIIPLFKDSNDAETAKRDELFRRESRRGNHPSEFFLSFASNRAAVAMAVQQIEWALPGGRFAGNAKAEAQAEGAIEWLASMCLDANGKRIALA